MEPTDAEKVAAENIYERSGGNRVSFEEIPDSDRDRIMREIRSREAAIEQFVIRDMFINRLGEGRSVPRRFMLAALLVIAILATIAIVVGGVMSLVGIR